MALNRMTNHVLNEYHAENRVQMAPAVNRVIQTCRQMVDNAVEPEHVRRSSLAGQSKCRQT
mgnify:CR=1 FL=1